MQTGRYTSNQATILKQAQHNLKLASNYQVLSPYEFLADFRLEAENATKRVWTQAMYVESGEVTTALSDILITAQSNGLNTRLHCDWFSLKFSHGKYIVPGSSRFKAKRAIFDRLSKAGIIVTFTNPPTFFEHIFPYKGRNHMKLTIIDDIAYLGGVNYADNDFKFADFMIKVTDTLLVDSLASVFLATEKGKLRDEKIRIDQDTALLIDRGTTGYSLILDEALRAIQQAQISVYHTCQFVPDGRFLGALHKMYMYHRKILVIVPAGYSFNPVMNSLYKFNRLAITLTNQKIPIHYFGSMVHAKLTIIDEQTVIIGSHNMSNRGVRMGTGEIALLSSNKLLVRNLRIYFERLAKT